MMEKLRRYQKSSEAEATGTANEIFPVKKDYLDNLRAVVGDVPRILEDFWIENGYGFIRQAATGGRDANFSNMLLGPSTIASHLKKRRYRKHFDQAGEIAFPFFQADEDILLGLITTGPRLGSIVTYGPDRVVVSSSIEGFIDRLLEDPEFYFKEDVVPPETRWLV